MKKRDSKRHARKLVLCDFDGTITKQDVGYDFLNRFTKENWEGIDRDFVEGKIGSKEAYTRIARLIVGTKEEMIDFILLNSIVDPHFIEFHRFCKDQGIDLKIVSDGFGLYIGALLAHHNIEGIDFFANRIVFIDEKRIDIEFPYYNPECGDCGVCKRGILKKFRDDYDHIIFVGNGLSDRCIAGEADEVYAKSTLYVYCINNGIDFWNYTNFADITRNMSKEIKGIIFDLDGTLIDSVDAIHKSFNWALGNFGHEPIDREQLKVLSKESITGMMHQRVGSDALKDSMERFKEKYIELIMKNPPLFSDVKEVVLFLKKAGVILGVATNMEGRYAKEILKQSGIEKQFTSVIGADNPGLMKPNPKMIYNVLKGMNVQREDTVFVGDSAIDIETGKNAQMDVYVLPTGFETKEKLSENGPRRLLNRLDDLKKIIEYNRL